MLFKVIILILLWTNNIYSVRNLYLLICEKTTFSLFKEEIKCPKPEELGLKESYCYRNHVDILDRLYESSQSLLNLAKKKLGKEVIENEKVPEKVNII